MFWRFGFNSTSSIDTLLEKEGLVLDDLLAEEDLLQEVKSQNMKLLTFLSQPSNLKTLITFIISDNLPEQKLKYPLIAAEIFACEIPSISEAMDVPTLELLWSVLDKERLTPAQAANFSRVNTVLFSTKPSLITNIQQFPDAVNKLLKHVSLSSISDLILKLITVEDMHGVKTVEWLKSQGLIHHLFSLLSPDYESDVHAVAAQTILDVMSVSYQVIQPTLDPTQPPETRLIIAENTVGNALVLEMKTKESLEKIVGYMLSGKSSCLIHGVNILMDIVRRYCSEIEHAEIMTHNPQAVKPTQEKLHALAVDLNPLLSIIKTKLHDFKLVLEKQSSDPIETTQGSQLPLGLVRLKVCELFAELLHVQYLFTSSPLVEHLIGYEETTIIEGLIAINEILVVEQIFPLCISLFFAFQWNNYLHCIVYDMIAKVLNSFTYTVMVPDQPFTPLSASKIQILSASIRSVVLTIFKQGNLMSEIVNAQRLNDYQVEQPKGTRLGYMGHLTYMADEILKFLEKNGPLFEEITISEEWEEYSTVAFRETKERDRIPLGGVKPELTAHRFDFQGADDDFKLNAAPTKSETEEEEDNLTAIESVTYNDQFARYLCQRLVQDMPDKFIGDSSDEEDPVWQHDFDINQAVAHDTFSTSSLQEALKGDESDSTDSI